MDGVRERRRGNAAGVTTKAPGGANFSVSANGSLVFMTGAAEAGIPRSLVWVDRDGRETPIPADTQSYTSVGLSPGDQQVLSRVLQAGDADLFVYHLARDTPRLFASDSGFNDYPIWTPGGERIVWVLNGDIVWQAADGTGQVEPLTTSENNQVPSSWADDGQTLVMVESRPGTAIDIGLLSMDGDPTIDWLLEGDANEVYPDVSPDGRWMAYTTDESGQFEVYVSPFPNVDERREKISQDGGLTPQWGPDGRALFFQTRNGTIMVAAIETEPTFNPGIPVPVFGEPYWISAATYPDRAFDISSDGQRLLVIKEGATTDTTVEEPEIHVVLNWTEELTRLVPTP